MSRMSNQMQDKDEELIDANAKLKQQLADIQTLYKYEKKKSVSLKKKNQYSHFCRNKIPFDDTSDMELNKLNFIPFEKDETVNLLR